MTELGTLSVKLTAATAEFARKMKGVQEKMRGVAETAKRVSKISAVAFAGMAASLAVVARAYDKQIRAERGLEAAFKAQGKAIDITRLKELASALQRVTLFGDEVTLANMKMLATFNVSEQGISRLIPGIQDVASALEIDMKTATLAVGKAMSGQAGALSRYGISLSKTQLKTMQLGNEQQRLAILTGALANFQGQAAIAASTAAGRFGQLSNNFGDVLENIGEIVDAPLAAVLNTISTAVVSVGAFIKNLSPEFKTWAGRIAIVVTVLTGVVAGVAALIAISPAIVGALGAIAAAAGMISVALWPVIIVLGAIGVVIASVILWVGIFKKAWDKNFLGIRDTVTRVVNEATAAWEFLSKGFAKSWEWMRDVAERILKTIGKWIEKWVNSKIGMLRRVGEALNIKSLASLRDIKIDLAFEKGKGEVLKLGEFIGDKIKKGADFVAEAWATGTEETKKILQPLIDGLKDLMDIKLPEMPTALGAGVGVGAGVPAGAGPTAAGEAAGEAAGGMQKVSNAADLAAGAIGQLGEGGGVVANVIRGFAEGGIWGAIIGFFMRVIKRLGVLQPVIDAFMDLLVWVAIALKPVVSALAPLSVQFIRLGALLFVLAIKIFPLFMLIIALEHVLEEFAEGIGKLAKMFVRNWNWMVDALANIFGKLPWIGDALERYIKSFAIVLDETQQPLQGAADALGEGGTSLRRGAEDAAEGMRELSESMANVPSGFKVAFARFEASDPLNVGLGGGPLAERGSAGGINVENMAVYADDPLELSSQLRDESEWQGFAGTGSPGADSEARFMGERRRI